MLRVITVLYTVIILAVISWIDFKTKRIPDRWNLALLAAGVWSCFVFEQPVLASRIGGLFVISVPMLLMAVFFPGALGGGDIKLMAAAGLLLGVQGVLTAAFFGMGAAGIYGAGLLILKKAGRKDSFALGPFLCAGIATALLPELSGLPEML